MINVNISKDCLTVWIVEKKHTYRVGFSVYEMLTSNMCIITGLSLSYK